MQLEFVMETTLEVPAPCGQTSDLWRRPMFTVNQNIKSNINNAISPNGPGERSDYLSNVLRDSFYLR